MINPGYFRLLMTLLLVFTVSTALAIDPPTKSSRRKAVVELLSGKEQPTAQQLRAIGASVDSVLTDVINDKRIDSAIRLRAVSCLGYYQTRQARTMLRTLVTDSVWDKPYKGAALVALAHSAGHEEYDTVKGYTSDSDPDIRVAAIRSLVIMGGERVLNLLKTLQLNETDPHVLDVLDSSIRQLGRAPWEVM